MSDPRIEYDDDETLDEFVAHDVQLVHFEAMGRASWWIAVELRDGRSWHINVGAHNDRVKAFAVCEQVDALAGDGAEACRTAPLVDAEPAEAVREGEPKKRPAERRTEAQGEK